MRAPLFLVLTMLPAVVVTASDARAEAPAAFAGEREGEGGGDGGAPLDASVTVLQAPSPHGVLDAGSLLSPSAPLVPTKPAAVEPSWRTTGSWGWFLVATAFAVGSAVTVAGLTKSCPDGVNDCSRTSGILIWGGVGIAGIGSLIGLLVVSQGKAKTQQSTAQQ